MLRISKYRAGKYFDIISQGTYNTTIGITSLRYPNNYFQTPVTKYNLELVSNKNESKKFFSEKKHE